MFESFKNMFKSQSQINQEKQQEFKEWQRQEEARKRSDLEASSFAAQAREQANRDAIRDAQVNANIGRKKTERHLTLLNGQKDRKIKELASCQESGDKEGADFAKRDLHQIFQDVRYDRRVLLGLKAAESELQRAEGRGEIDRVNQQIVAILKGLPSPRQSEEHQVAIERLTEERRAQERSWEADVHQDENFDGDERLISDLVEKELQDRSRVDLEAVQRRNAQLETLSEHLPRI